MPTHANANDRQVLVVPEYKEDLRNQPIITELRQHEWELVICEQMKQHTYCKQYQRDNYKYTISIGKSRPYYQRQLCLGFGNIPPLGSRNLKHLRYFHRKVPSP